MKRIKLLLLLPAAALFVLSCQKSKQDQGQVQAGSPGLAGREGGEQLSEHIIPLSLAQQYSQRFLNLRDSVLPLLLSNGQFLEQQFNMPLCETFCRESIDALLAVDGASSVRIYLGVDDAGKMRLVLMPVDSEGNNIITTLSGGASKGLQGRGTDEEEGDAVENGHRPPPYPDL